MTREAIVCDGDSSRVRMRRGTLCLDYDLRTGRYAITHGDACTSPVGASHAARHAWETDLLGRPGGWSRVHVVDSSVFPSLPGTTVALLAMANAVRIADAAIEG